MGQKLAGIWRDIVCSIGAAKIDAVSKVKAHVGKAILQHDRWSGFLGRMNDGADAASKEAAKKQEAPETEQHNSFKVRFRHAVEVVVFVFKLLSFWPVVHRTELKEANRQKAQHASRSRSALPHQWVSALGVGFAKSTLRTPESEFAKDTTHHVAQAPTKTSRSSLRTRVAMRSCVAAFLGEER